jgi:hypothetical protein
MWLSLRNVSRHNALHTRKDSAKQKTRFVFELSTTPNLFIFI